MEYTDQEVYERIREGERPALGALYDRLEPALYRYALHMSGNREIAEETVHEAFLVLIQGNARFDAGRGSLEAYLYGTVRNLVRAALRNTPVEADREPEAEDQVVSRLIGDERTAALYGAIRELPAEYREAVALCDLEERSYEEAARLMDCPVGTVRSRLYRARRLLAEKLKQYSASRKETTR